MSGLGQHQQRLFIPSHPTAPSPSQGSTLHLLFIYSPQTRRLQLTAKYKPHSQSSTSQINPLDNSQSFQTPFFPSLLWGLHDHSPAARRQHWALGSVLCCLFPVTVARLPSPYPALAAGRGLRTSMWHQDVRQNGFAARLSLVALMSCTNSWKWVCRGCC